MKDAGCVILILLFSIKVSAQPALPLSLTGNWQMAGKGMRIGEHWQQADSLLLTGTGYTLRGKDSIVTERIRIEKRGDAIYYIPTVTRQNNGQPVYFVLTSFSANQYIFENPLHDYPRRIVYELKDGDSLDAWIDDGHGKQRMDFHYIKVKY